MQVLKNFMSHYIVLEIYWRFVTECTKTEEDKTRKQTATHKKHSKEPRTTAVHQGQRANLGWTGSQDDSSENTRWNSKDFSTGKCCLWA